MKAPSLSKLLETGDFPSAVEDKAYTHAIHDLQLQMLRVQQGMYQQQRRAVVAFEGFDASGKGGAIRRLTSVLDPRGYKVWPIGPPTALEQHTHYLYRFWTRLPHAGNVGIFDRSWYGRVLVERVEKLIPKADWKRAYREIVEFERTLVDDGIPVVKIFLAISKDEQLRRFRDRIQDPYRSWKLTEDDLKARGAWDRYVGAADAMFEQTSTHHAPWHLVAANDKPHARRRVLEIVTGALDEHRRFIEKEAKAHRQTLEKQLRALEKHAR